MAGGSSAFVPQEPGFLDTPTYTLSLLLLFFLVVCLGFEKGTDALIRFLKKRKRNGLAQAVSNLVLELTLVGLVSLLLIVLQDAISNICVPYSSGSYTSWTLIGNVRGCDCCLQDTSTVGACFTDSRDCGPKYCNCEAQDAACLAPQATLGEVLAQWGADAACNATACGADYLQQVVDSPQAAAARSVLDLECDGIVRVSDDICGEGKTQLISITALHQVHILIFCVAGTHVAMGVITVLLSSWRLHLWRRQCADDDEHARGVREILDRPAPVATPGLGRLHWSRLMPSNLSRTRRAAEQAASPGAPGAASPISSPASPHADPDDVERGGVPASDTALPAKALAPGPSGRRGGMAAVVAAAVAAAKLADDGSKTGRLDHSTSSGSDTLAGDSPPGEAAPVAAEQEPPPPVQDLALVAPHSASGDEVPRTSSSRVIATEPVAALEVEGSGAPAAAAVGPASGGHGPNVKRMSVLKRSTTIKRGDYAGWAWEYAVCFLHQFHPRPVTAEDLRLMRASFMLTHRVPAGFDFWTYISASMEDDFSQIVGVSLEMWLTLVLFVLISGPLGWAAVLFVALAALVLAVLNTKICAVMRHVCRGARVNELSSSVFWFDRPALLLHPIKYLLFLCSFMFGSAIFFVWSFGSHSCPFTAHGNAFWFAWLPPWWVSLIVSGLIFLDAATRTLPCYSLAVQMGSDFKHHMLPSGIKHRLLRMAERIKLKHKEQLAAAAAAEAASAEGSRRGGVQYFLSQLKSERA